MEVIEGYVTLRNKAIPLSEWEGRVAGGESRYEVVSPRLYGTFVSVATMAVMEYMLK